MADVDRLCEILGAEQLAELNAELEKEQVRLARIRPLDVPSCPIT